LHVIGRALRKTPCPIMFETATDAAAARPRLRTTVALARVAFIAV
jgi:hypothetical protein